MHASQIADMNAMSEAEIAAIAYTEAAEGDVDQALRYAVEDLLTLEVRYANALRDVSAGYVKCRVL